MDGQISYEEGFTEGYNAEFDEALVISEEEFIERMLEAGGRDAAIPPIDEVEFYPLMRFLTLTTENGTRYQVNPDRSLSRMPEDYPLAISPDGAHVAFRVEDGQIVFQYISTVHRSSEERTFASPEAEAQYQRLLENRTVQGQAVQFTNESSFAAVWDQSQLSIYMLSNDFYDEYGKQLILRTVAQVSLQPMENAALPTVMWSSDSTTLVWEDGSGIWHWDIYDEAAPQQLISAADIQNIDGGSPALLDVSTYGRYVRVGTSETWMLIDAETHELYANALAAPNEQFLIFNSEDAPYLGEHISAYCVPPLHDTCFSTIYQETMENSFVYVGNLLGFAVCEGEECLVKVESWHPSIVGTHYNGGRYLREDITGLRQITYDPQNEQAALLVGEYRIYLDFYDDRYFEREENLPYMDFLDLEGRLDSPIVSIEWGLPIFYEQYALTTAEYLPR